MTSQTCSYEGCERPVYNKDEGKCIFHCEKKDPQQFRNALAKQIRQWRKKKAWKWDFGGWVFVDVEERSNLFRSATVMLGKPAPIAVVTGPLRATLLWQISSRIPSGRGVPYLSSAFAPASKVFHSISTPVASMTFWAAPTTSGPMPSPPITPIL